MSTHTPGPWSFSRWEQLGDTRFYVAQADGAPYTPNYSDVATLVAETASGERVAIQEANACLIAAAPELLEACHTFALWCQREEAGFPDAASRRSTPEGEQEWRKWYNENLRLCALAQEQANAAITKATGVQS